MDLYSARTLKQQSAGRHIAPLGPIILIPCQPVFARQITKTGDHLIQMRSSSVR